MNNYIIYKNDNDTITAISSPLGIGAISIIRISGDKSIKIIKKIFVNKKKKIYKEKANLGIIKDNKEIIDKVIIIYFKNPNSYTGEDLVEIYCHGSIYIQNKIIKIIIKNGGRLAKKGEFTYRAYFNKKITLLEAESVLDTIKCENEIEHKIAINNLIKNKLYKVILKIQKKILNILSYIEVNLDFIEENININSKKIYNKILYVEKKIKKLIYSFKISYIIKKGLYISIIGPVNSGKSTLMNTLINEDKSIISNIPGTTRDIVEGNILINNFNFYLFDTAGIRKSKSNIEKIGIKKTFKNIEKSNIIFYVFDYNLLKKNIKKLKKQIINKFFKKDLLLIANKIDLKNNLKLKKIRKIKIKKYIYNIIFISAKKKIGIKNIIDYLKRKIPNKIIQNNILINNIRHYEELRQTLKNINKIKKDYLKKKSLEFISIDLRRSLKFLYNIHGKNFDNNEVLNNIFTKFCIGK
ncbi:MAG: tRNA uridine-5-carboxymethylaminomethyl(34) synthesis GTPase MnmE [Candidatus Shikimatogenerans bostrichidophilus]|nr:MAG: tRNA uridine-5-carboxymethylaminomethyl(34) synthesis GTPase MnmE [Candidatus Shikimatogenerans bostrichidophilus]